MEIGVSTNRIPQFLYKYKSQQYLKSLQVNNELWFSSPQDFNDPFDCQITLDADNTYDEIAMYLSRDSRATPEKVK